MQVGKEHYTSWGYLSRERWMSYWYQLEAVVGQKPERVLEVGVGNRVVADTLEKLGIGVTTIDIDPALGPTVVGSVVQMPFAEGSFDLVLVAEVLEHLRWDDLQRALSESRRVTRGHVVVTLPHVGYVFAISWKLPSLAWRRWLVKLPHFWKVHAFDGEHYWEIGKRGFSARKVRREFGRAGFRVVLADRHPDDPGRRRFVLEKLDRPAPVS